MSIFIALYCLDIPFLKIIAYLFRPNMNSKQACNFFYTRINQEMKTQLSYQILIFREQHLHEVGLKTFRFYQFLRL